MLFIAMSFMKAKPIEMFAMYLWCIVKLTGNLMGYTYLNFSVQLTWFSISVINAIRPPNSVGSAVKNRVGGIVKPHKKIWLKKKSA